MAIDATSVNFRQKTIKYFYDMIKISNFAIIKFVTSCK